MGSYTSGRMAEIRRQFGTVLRELGVRPRMRRVDDSIVVEFLPTTSTGNFSPVAIVFDNQAITGLEEASWEHAHLHVVDYRRREVGDTGWVAVDEIGQRKIPIRHEGQRMFDWISFVMEYEGVVPYQVPSPGYLASPEVADAYERVAFWNPDTRIEREIDEHIPVETLIFTDKDEREVRIEYRLLSSDARLVIDGHLTERFRHDDFLRLTEIVRALMDERYEDKNRFRARR